MDIFCVTNSEIKYLEKLPVKLVGVGKKMCVFCRTHMRTSTSAIVSASASKAIAFASSIWLEVMQNRYSANRACKILLHIWSLITFWSNTVWLKITFSDGAQ